ncbi:hypothetical protein ACGTN9_08805 [Halobacillus sp. MO56]
MNPYYLPQSHMPLNMEETMGYGFEFQPINHFPQYDGYEHFDNYYGQDRQPPQLERRVTALERQNEQQGREINRLDRENNRQAREINRLNNEINQLQRTVEQHTRRLNRLNQRLRTVENRLGVPFSPGEGGF